MLAIGFTKQYYTLWDVSSKEQHNGYFYYTQVMYTFIQNLSKDLNKALEKAVEMGCTNLDVNSELYGRNKSWELLKDKKVDKKKVSLTENDKLFRILFVNDKENTTELRDIVFNTLLERGYFVEVGGVHFLAKHKESAESLFSQYQNNSINLEFTLEKNVDYEGHYLSNREDGFTRYIFSEITKMTYNGFTYFIPALNGKGKKCKGKTVKVTDYELEGKSVGIFHEDLYNCWSSNNRFFYTEDEAPEYFNGKNPTIIIKNFEII